jgi:hypothetical protein
MEFIHTENRIGLSTLLMSLMVTSAVIKLTDASITIDKLLSTTK